MLHPSVVILLSLIILLYIVSSRIQTTLIGLFSNTIPMGKFVVYLIWFLYFPGIVLHELSHLIGAVALFLHVKSIHLLPSISENEEGHREIKLGSVTYNKADPIRGILVGVAPFFIGSLVLILLFQYIHFPNPKTILNILFIYLTFVISSTMFSSKKDLQDLFYIIPTIALFVFIFFILQFNPFSYIHLSLSLQKNGVAFVNQINQMFTLSLIINLVIYAIVKLIKR